MTSFIKLSRDILTWEWYDDPNTFRVFIHLLLNANYEDKKYHGIEIKRGQVVVGLCSLAETLGLSVRNVRTAFEHLKSTNEVTIETTNKFSIVTICNIERWQGQTFVADKQNDKQNDTPTTSNRQTTDKQMTTPKEIKKERKEEYINPPLSPQGEEIDKLLAKISEMEGKQKELEEVNVKLNEKQKELEEENAKLKEKIEKDKKANRDLDLSIVSEEMLPVVEEWLAYKRQKKQSFKPMGFVRFYNKLLKDCGGSVTVAKQMVDFSIANNYDGLFKPKESYRRKELPGQVIREENLDFDKGFFGL